MRKIKFRAWDKDAKTMVYQSDNGDEYCWQVGAEEIWAENIIEDYTLESNLMQYTGLKDKNGVEIYEGDIVRAKLINILDFIIIFEKGRFTMKMILGSNINDSEDQRWILNEECEIIGNIYENPELLVVK